MTYPDNEIQAVAFFTADHAAVENGKAYVNGGFWDRMQFPSFPAPASFAVVAVLNVPWHEYHKQHRFRIRIEDADGTPLPAEFNGDFQVGAAPDMKVGQPTVMPIAGLVNGLPFERPGAYAFILDVDGRDLARWTVNVTPVSVPGPSGPPGPASIPGLGG
ncbi:MAG TPA: hypothetical protein VF519_00960 [Mycobacteriales bacterium]|jgi:hypothetical protein